ncbi:MAG TPA: M20 family metallopeptidase [Acetomicrobium flavidum]|uniref:M20 metallopeptidase family protein n=1 Tax=Acetomicrobium flavidum TaxID=49896 RepID=UPI002BF881A7|nr:M20 family metallopeptidase [Acetomicrobium flavidum]
MIFLKLEEIVELAEELEEKVIKFRRDFHAHPELSWKEERTSKVIEQVLKELGFENVRRGFGGTESGVVGDITGRKEVPLIALRADIDALPIEEEADVPWRSINKGVMHACGHDAHAAILLGVAHMLASLKDKLPCKVRLIFQPAEESGVRSGARQLIEEGALDGVEAIWGLHVWSSLPAGKIGYRSGPTMASADIWEVEIKGKGGHGSRPHEAIDPTIAAASIVLSLQTIISRELDPQETAVLSIGRLESGSAPNVIPEKALIQGNIRTTNSIVRDELPGSIERIAKGIGSALRCEVKTNFIPVYPVTVNDPDMVETLKKVASAMFGDQSLTEMPIVMGSEDFSFYQQKIPGVIFFLGMADSQKGTDAEHHNPTFKTNDGVLKKGVALLTALVMESKGEE